jgi:hypothetical protein
LGSHLDCIGIPIDGGFTETVLSYKAAAQKVVQRRTGGRYFAWTDPSGAQLHIDEDTDGYLDCVRPAFASNTTLTLLNPTFVIDGDSPGCPLCVLVLGDVIDPDGSLLYPIAAGIADSDWDPAGLPDRLTTAITGFAERVTWWPDAASYRATNPAMSVESLIPTGTFVPPGQPEQPTTPRVLMTGRVLEAERRKNQRSGEEFDWARIQSYGQAYEVVVSPDDLDGPLEPGNVIQGTFWMIIAGIPAGDGDPVVPHAGEAVEVAGPGMLASKTVELPADASPPMPPSPPAGTVIRGTFAWGFEVSSFRPDGAAESWWTWFSDAVQAEWDIFDGRMHYEGATVRFAGNVSQPGRFGHLGAYAREFQVTSIVEVEGPWPARRKRPSRPERVAAASAAVVRQARQRLVRGMTRLRAPFRKRHRSGIPTGGEPSSNESGPCPVCGDGMGTTTATFCKDCSRWVHLSCWDAHSSH